MIEFEKDSRLIKPGQTFIAIKGDNIDGHDCINEAIKNGATKIIAEKKINSAVPLTIVPNTENFLQEKIVQNYSSQLKDLKIIGVTGTNGKTTSCYLTYQILQNLNINVAYIGTIGFYHQEESFELDNTTPDILTLYKLLFKAKDLGCTHIVMEVSSHALALKRIEGLTFIIAAFTNLTQDHLNFHQTMENYLNEKLKIINYLNKDSIFIVNSDDLSFQHFIKAFPKALTLGMNGNYKIESFKTTPANTHLNFSYQKQDYEVDFNLTSKFNVYNFLTSLAIIHQLGFAFEKIISIAKNIKPPKGRCETIQVNKGFAVIDYAHTPDAVEKVITAYSELKENKIITIIGCGGDRDPQKRPIMGNIATTLSDYVIFTNDNPRTEKPENIMEGILKGVKKTNYEVILDRKMAIKKAIDIMGNKDIILILGKGHENYQILGYTKHHLDDAEEVHDWIQNNQ